MANNATKVKEYIENLSDDKKTSLLEGNNCASPESFVEKFFAKPTKLLAMEMFKDIGLGRDHKSFFGAKFDAHKQKASNAAKPRKKQKVARQH